MPQETLKKRPLLIPEYIQEFSCIGSACEDSCCSGWRVNIDEATYKKYKKSEDIELKPLFEKNVTRQRSQSTPLNYAKLKMGNNNSCSFLTEEKLCHIQMNLGEEALSNTCATYPRVINRINGVVEKSATMSCPEAARLTLLNPRGIDFNQVEEPVDTKGFIAKDLTTDDMRYTNKIQKYFWELRIFSIQVIQDRQYTLAERLIILGLFYQKVQEHVDQDNVQIIPKEIAKFSNLLADQGMKQLLVEVPTQLSVQMELCKELVDYRVGQSITSKRYFDCLTEMLVGIQYTKETTVEEVTVHYQQAFEAYYEPFMTEHEYILENYLVNYIFKNMFPLGQKVIFDDYVMLVIHYSMIKLHLIGMAGFHKGLTTELVIKLIQSFAKTVEHNDAYLRKIFNLLKENEFTTMAYMAILVKN